MCRYRCAILTPRLAPPVFGAGLLEAIPESDVLAMADPDDADEDGISGRPNQVLDVSTGADGAGPLRVEGKRPDRGTTGGRRLHR